MTTEWAKAYVAALRDLRLLLKSRGALTPTIEQLFDDLHGDAKAIDHEAENREQRRKLRTDCGSPNVTRAGTCLLCQDCGSTSGGCS